ncbi:copper chaperone PCu(A)C [Salipiger pacificus]|nr:copper chaperone PCu(A)C [Alloyangia pacifica]MCA0943415.1 copper chaperone PCu(A)C [Alloyangia pacifica]
MRLKIFAAVALALSTAGMARADILVEDAYARAAMPSAPTAAVYLELRNDGAEDDVLLGASSGSAAKTMLHGSSEGAGGVMTMTAHSGGVVIPAGGSHVFAPGGDHVMLMGLTQPLETGATLGLTLTFERAGEIRIEVPVELTR